MPSQVPTVERLRQESFHSWTPTVPPDSKWLTYDQAVVYTNLTRNTLHDYVSNGTLKAYEANRANTTVKRFLREDLDKLFTEVRPTRNGRKTTNGSK